MPRLQPESDPHREARLTNTQYQIMQLWANGAFQNDGPPDWHSLPPAPDLSALAVADRPFALDKAALDACVGASFFPGIEAPRILREEPTLYEALFRIQRELPAGAITRGLAIPWQTDFGACGVGWWPAQRPNSVFRRGQRDDWDKGAPDMVDQWKFLGFVVPAAAGAAIPYIEDERDLA